MNLSVTSIAPWVGGARINAERIGVEIGHQDLVVIPCCGGCSEVPHIDARQILINDVHDHVITLAVTVADDSGLERLQAAVENLLVHPGFLRRATETIRAIEEDEARQWGVDPEWAAAYFAIVWLSRSSAGSDTELTSGLSARYTATGGSSAKRLRSAIEGLREWHALLKEKCEFNCRDFRDLLDRIEDRKGHAIYVDPPWKDAKVRYKHTFTEEDHRDLASLLGQFRGCRVVIRHSDHPLYRELYPVNQWTWTPIGGRNQGNKRISEVLITNGPSHSEPSQQGLFA